ncbi:MAG: carboxypeptidase regulatory-like domain-containing protein [Chloroflexi bacterium]|nr:carboxypeptidase regulatory-like domain-containing protein [Chloroflexota bacterium]
MSFANPANRIPRYSIDGMEGMWVKMWDPPKTSPSTPDKVLPTNPVPEVMASRGYQRYPSQEHTVDRTLLHGEKIRTWDSAKELVFFLIGDHDNPSAAMGTYPGPTLHVPRGVVFHAQTQGKGPPPHTIHWHGIEPTPMNDGVGHCSMEIGQYTYQWQPNFIGFYFYHCHRNTVQHFEFGLFGALVIEPSDAYFATIVDPNIPIGHCRDGKRRTAANLTSFPQFTGWKGGLLTDQDPWASDPQGTHDSRLIFPTDPHAMTVPYDVEVLWVYDDRDSVWSDMAPDARATYPKHGNYPGVDDRFDENHGKDGFFAFNQFNADYWFITGVPVPAHKGETGTIPGGIVIPAALNSGISGTQVSIEAEVGQTILVRGLDAAYDCVDVTFPMDVVVIAWDGRALGVPPYGQYNAPYTVPAGTHIHQSVARRFEALIKVDSPINDFATVEFVDNEGQVEGDANAQRVIATARIPINIGYAISGKVTQGATPLTDVTVTLSGAAGKTAATDASGNYRFSGLLNGSYTVTPSLEGFTFDPASIAVTVSGASVPDQDFAATQAEGFYVVSGSVISSRGAVPIPDATVTLTGDAQKTITTDVNGNYRFYALPAGRYTITVSHMSYQFSPVERGVTVSNSNARVSNFRGRLMIM